MLRDPIAGHVLLVATRDGRTLGECACGAWRREVTTETVALTGRSREDALREAHELHAREGAAASPASHPQKTTVSPSILPPHVSSTSASSR